VKVTRVVVNDRMQRGYVCRRGGKASQG